MAKNLTMADLMAKNKTTVICPQKGSEVEGKVVEISHDRVVMNIGGKFQGMIAGKALIEAREIIKTVKVGDTLSGQVIVSETRDGYCVVSLKRSVNRQKWDELSKAFEQKTPVSVMVKSINTSGLLFDVNGIFGFVPTSQFGRDFATGVNSLVGKKILVVIIDLDEGTRKVVASEKMVSEKEEMEKILRAVGKIKTGEIYEGVISSISDFGVFVTLAIKNGSETVSVDGLAHISELSWEKVGRPSDSFEAGDKVKVKVLEVHGNKISLSIKQTLADPWTQALSKYQKGEKYEGTVVKHTDFGIFVALEAGVEGLIHMTKIPHNQTYERGTKIDVEIEEIDEQTKKIALNPVLTSKPIGYK